MIGDGQDRRTPLPDPDQASRRWAQRPELAHARRLFALASQACRDAAEDRCDAARHNDEVRDLGVADPLVPSSFAERLRISSLEWKYAPDQGDDDV